MVINKRKIPLSSQHKISIEVARLPSDTLINMDVHIFRGAQEGPCILLTAGIHGDEINGIEILRSMLESNFFSGIKKGTLIVIPLVNTFGFINFSRDVPDGKDVNRSFPGSAKGSLAAKISHHLSRDILPHVDTIIDFHTGGSTRYNYPQIRVNKNDDYALKIAKSSGVDLILTKNIIPRSFRSYATKLNKTVLVFEGGESVRYDTLSIQKGKSIIKNVLNYFNVIKTNSSKLEKPLIYHKTKWVRSQASGLFNWISSSGTHITKGQIIGEINTLAGKKTFIKAPFDGFIVGHNNAAVVNHGDPLFNVGISD